MKHIKSWYSDPNLNGYGYDCYSHNILYVHLVADYNFYLARRNSLQHRFRLIVNFPYPRGSIRRELTFSDFNYQSCLSIIHKCYEQCSESVPVDKQQFSEIVSPLFQAALHAMENET